MPPKKTKPVKTEETADAKVPVKKFTNAVTNHFLKINKLDENKISNPQIANTGIELPTRILLNGPSGSGKNNVVMEFLKRTPNVFDEIHVAAKNVDQPFYVYLKKKIPEECYFEYGVGEIPCVDDFDPSLNRLLIVDDYANDKVAQKQCIDWWIRGRHKKFTCLFLTQSFHRGCDKVIRAQCDYIIITKVNSARDLKLIISEFPVDIEYKELLNIYTQCTKKMGDFLLIDLVRCNIRHNFLQVVHESQKDDLD